MNPSPAGGVSPAKGSMHGMAGSAATDPVSGEVLKTEVTLNVVK